MEEGQVDETLMWVRPHVFHSSRNQGEHFEKVFF